MSFQIKQEPIDEYDEHPTGETSQSYIDMEYESQRAYLNNLRQSVLFSQDDEDAELFSMQNLIESEAMRLAESVVQIKSSNSIPISDILSQITLNRPLSPDRVTQTSSEVPSSTVYDEEMAREKKKILAAISEQVKLDKQARRQQNLRVLTMADEERLINILDKMTETSHAMRRLRAKLAMRQAKRANHKKLFDLDSMVNELIDREKLKHDESQAATNLFDDVIFEGVTLKTSCGDSNNDIIELVPVLDRFNKRRVKLMEFESFGHEYSTLSHIGMVESRNEDVKCLISPYSNKVLKPFVRRDYHSMPLRLLVNKQIIERVSALDAPVTRASIDYVHLRPEHVLPINQMCREHFWPGVDISECLEYPDLSIVAMYRKLIVGFAFIVPNAAFKEAYLTFILVHPDWRSHKSASSDQKCQDNDDVALSEFMMYYLIQACGDMSISLHVRVKSPAVLFYQKFGFKIEEYIKNFYDKYQTFDDQSCKDAFMMRLTH